MMNQLQQISTTLKGRANGKGIMVCCPAHNDKNPSLAIDVGDNGKLILKCFAGCPNDKVIEALKSRGLWPTNNNYEKKKPAQPVEDFEKTNEWIYELANLPRLRVERFESLSGKKKFMQSSWNSTGWAYGKGDGICEPLYYSKWKDKASIILAEGEKTADAINALHPFAATTTPGGSGAWMSEFAQYFSGKNVYMLPDNDDPGEKFMSLASKDILPIAKEVKVIRLPNLEPAQDAVEWIKAGGTWPKLIELIKNTEALKTPLSKYVRISDDIKIDKARRIKNSEKKISFGVNFLDKALGGIYPNDLILVGAKTGVGKTEFVTSVALSALREGKRVVQFALEAELGEITNRLKYKLIANEYYNGERFKYQSSIKKLNYMDWMAGLYDEKFVEIEEQINDKLNFEMFDYRVRYKEAEDFTVQMLVEEIQEVKNEADLIIIDHFHFLDFNDGNENQAQTKAASMIRDLSLSLGVPIILVAHVRKSDRGNVSIVPDIEDFQGTSNLAKICTKAIMLAPLHSETKSTTLFPTLFKIAKNRRDGSRCRYLGAINFDVKTNTYQDKFAIGQISLDGKKFNAIEGDLIPYWAKEDIWK